MHCSQILLYPSIQMFGRPQNEDIQAVFSTTTNETESTTVVIFVFLSSVGFTECSWNPPKYGS